MMNAPRVRFMLDSGAFSVFHKGETVKLDDYCRFIEQNHRKFWQYVSLDDIGSPDESAENHAAMKARGLAPMPVFHAGESIAWLKQMIADGEKYIGLSLSAFDDKLSEAAQQKQIELLDEAFTVLWPYPNIKLHLFGTMKPELLQRYSSRWNSADSSGWVKLAKYGRIYAPHWDEALNGYDYRKPPVSMNVNDFDTESDYTDIRFKTRLIQKWLVDNSFGPADVALPRVRNIPEQRRRALLIYYQLLCRVLEIEAVFATLKQQDLSDMLNDMHADTRLLSYVNVKHWSRLDSSYYVRYGKAPPSQKTMTLKLLELSQQEPPEP